MLTNWPLLQTTRTTAPVDSLRLALVHTPDAGGVIGGPGIGGVSPVPNVMFTGTVLLPDPPTAGRLAATSAASRQTAIVVVRHTERRSLLVVQDQRMGPVRRRSVGARSGPAGARLAGGHRAGHVERLRCTVARGAYHARAEHVLQVDRAVGHRDCGGPGGRRGGCAALQAERVRQAV